MCQFLCRLEVPLTQNRKVFAMKTCGKIFLCGDFRLWRRFSSAEKIFLCGDFPLCGEDVFGRRFATRSKTTGKEGELLSQNAKEF